MTTGWKCHSCDVSNDLQVNQCPLCGRLQTESSLFEEIMEEQRLLFQGYIRTEILNKIDSNSCHRHLMTKDVITVCNDFYTVDITSEKDNCREKLLTDDANGWMNILKQDAELYILDDLCDQLYVEKQFFIGYKLCKLLLELNDNDPSSHQLMANILMEWNKVNITENGSESADMQMS